MTKKRTYKRLPCKTCPTFVMCKEKNPLVCKLLYQYILDDHMAPCDSTFYRRIRQIKLMFNKEYYNWYINSKHELGIQWLIGQKYRLNK